MWHARVAAAPLRASAARRVAPRYAGVAHSLTRFSALHRVATSAAAAAAAPCGCRALHRAASHTMAQAIDTDSLAAAANAALAASNDAVPSSSDDDANSLLRQGDLDGFIDPSAVEVGRVGGATMDEQAATALAKQRLAMAGLSSSAPLPPPPPQSVSAASATSTRSLSDSLNDGDIDDADAAALSVSSASSSTSSPPRIDELTSAVSASPCHPSSLLSLPLYNQLKAELHGPSALVFTKMCMRASVAPKSSDAKPTWVVVPEWDFNDRLTVPLSNKSQNWPAMQAAITKNNAAVQKIAEEHAASMAAAAGASATVPEPSSDPSSSQSAVTKQEPFSKQQIYSNMADFLLSPFLHQSERIMQAVRESQPSFLALATKIESERLALEKSCGPASGALNKPRLHQHVKKWKNNLSEAWAPRSSRLLVALVDQFVAFMDEPIEPASASAGNDASAAQQQQSEESMLASFGFKPAPKVPVTDKLLKMRSGRLQFDPTLAALTNFSAPHEWYPLARGLNRRFIVHVGPTNSGKTYHAMQRLMQAKSGLYAGPLRLLAWEVKDKMSKAGVPCSLRTGQEVDEVEGASHISSTVEMVDTDTIVDVAVVDEAQLLASADRGSAWTRALLGVPAYEVHVCGDPSMVEIVEELAAITGEPVEVREYHRLTPLSVTPPLVGGVRGLRKGDCVVAFSRKKLYDLKKDIEETLALKVCIIYGSLPPEVRRQQAELFNDPSSGYDVLVASDAIGMGLNLNIGRVVFQRMEKFDGRNNRPLTPSETLQIAGRAGRFNTGASKDSSSAKPISTMAEAAQSNRGECTTMLAEEHEYLQWAMKQPLAPIDRVGLAPSFEQLQLLHTLRPKETLSNLLTYFSHYAKLDSLYFTVNMEGMKAIADVVEDVPFASMKDRWSFCQAPAKMDIPYVRDAIKLYANLFARGEIVAANSMKMNNLKTSNSEINLSMMETFYQVLDLYVWLGIKFGAQQFVDLEKTTTIRDTVGRIVLRGLGDITPSDAWFTRRRKEMARAARVAHAEQLQKGGAPLRPDEVVPLPLSKGRAWQTNVTVGIKGVMHNEDRGASRVEKRQAQADLNQRQQAYSGPRKDRPFKPMHSKKNYNEGKNSGKQ